MKKQLIGLFVIASMLLSACGAGNFAVTSAEVTDYITNTEEINNGAFVVWVRTDPTTSYCTIDRAIYDLARKYREQMIPVTIAYQGINAGDKDAVNWLGLGKCSYGDSTTKTKTYRLMSIAPANSKQ